ncbi:MAG: DNA/RNA non-specific endonuclease [Bacteroidales bacterium]|nr:DNA/RNA non-specific endonuclease [Bacteroidales bacterium]
MSSGGATLQGSYSGETGSITETGFYYGTTSGSLGTKVMATGTSSPFSKAITGLTPNTTYYYKAYVIEGGEERLGDEESFDTKAVATADVSTNAVGSVTQTSATLNGSYENATGTVSRVGFKWGTNSGNLDQDTYTNGNTTPFSKSLTGLTAGTTYYFKAYVVEYNENASGTEYRYGTEQSFTTTSPAQQSLPGYLGCYEMPAVNGILSGSSQSGTLAARDDIWYRYYTNNSNRQIATHTFTHPTSGNKVRNYTVLYDGTRYAPLWTAHVMHSSMWPDKGVGRNESWTSDPAIDLTQQSGLDNANGVGYSRGHLVASNYRQSSVEQNKQTFYYSNQAPQWQNSFNSGVWSSLEEAVAANAPSGRDTLYVVTGVLYEGNVSTLPSGNLNVPIPSHFYKCLMKCSFNAGGTMTAASGIAYIFTNEAHGGNYYDNANVTTIDAIETRAGFDFFASVPTSLQNAAESVATPLW